MNILYENRRYSKKIKMDFLYGLSNLSYPTHCQDDNEFIFVQEGEITVGVNSREETIGSGQAFFIKSGDIHYYRTDKKSKVCLLFFTDDMINGLNYIYSFFTEPIDKRAELLIDLLIEESEERKSGYETAVKCLLTQIILMADRCSENSGEIERTEKQVTTNNIYHYIDTNFTSDLNASKLAEHFHISVPTLYRILKLTSGKSFKELIKIKRLIYARHLIENTRDSITDISTKSGFDNIRTFNRCFRAYYGCSPSHIRDGIANK